MDNQLIKKLKEQEFDALLITSVPLISYLTGYANFSIEEREAFLLITKNQKYILTDARYSEAIQKQVKEYKLIELGGNNTAKSVLEELNRKYNIESLGIEETNVNVAEYKLLKKIFTKISDVELSDIREIKTPEEIKKIQKSCAIGDKAFEYILTQLKLGLTEIEVANILEEFIRKQGAKLSFDTIIAFDKNSSIPHHFTSNNKLLEKSSGVFIKMDFGVKYENYCSDMTRTVFWGKPSDRQVEIYETVKAAQTEAVNYISERLKKGNREIKSMDVDSAARDYIISKGYPSIPHSLGHGIGLEVHEMPNLSPKSEKNLSHGMVFSIEPGIYLAGFGGVRIEDLYTIQNGKLIQLTKSTKELITLPV